MFKLINSEIENGTRYYIWETPCQEFLYGCDPNYVFPLAINLYLETCEDKEHIQLLDKRHLLYISFYEENGRCRISTHYEHINAISDDFFRQIVWTSSPDLLPCVITLGDYWYYIGIHRYMCRMRNINLGCDIPECKGYAKGIKVYYRDAYPNETEEEIQMLEQNYDMVILRS